MYGYDGTYIFMFSYLCSRAYQLLNEKKKINTIHIFNYANFFDYHALYNK